MTDWRLIDTGPLDAAANMAVDEALLACFDPANPKPVLRLYGWTPPALSLGRYQEAATSLDLYRCAADGVPVVRRMTGGGIIYHAEELTYSIVCKPEQVGEAAGVKAGFRRLCGFLLGTYQRLGLQSSFAIDSNPDGAKLGTRTVFCFAGKEECDIVVQGRKLGGNAQRRARGLILQHGSIPLQNRVPVGLQYVTDPSPGAEQAASLADLGVTTDTAVLKGLVCEAFEEALGIRLNPVSLSPEEAEAVERLTREKYGASRWNIEGIEG